jgi:uncharacterized protein YqfA (UPF0365 family)
MRRFRHRSSEAVVRRIERMRTLNEKHGAASVIDAAARKIPARLRGAAFVVAADIVLKHVQADTTMRDAIARGDDTSTPPKT